MPLGRTSLQRARQHCHSIDVYVGRTILFELATDFAHDSVRNYPQRAHPKEVVKLQISLRHRFVLFLAKRRLHHFLCDTFQCLLRRTFGRSGRTSKRHRQARHFGVVVFVLFAALQPTSVDGASAC